MFAAFDSQTILGELHLDVLAADAGRGGNNEGQEGSSGMRREIKGWTVTWVLSTGNV